MQLDCTVLALPTFFITTLNESVSMYCEEAEDVKEVVACFVSKLVAFLYNEIHL